MFGPRAHESGNDLPGMQDRKEADLGAGALRIGGHFEQRVGAGREQQCSSDAKRVVEYCSGK